MVISHKYKFIFIKSRKTAGTSLEVFLSQHCGAEDVFTPIIPIEEGHTPRNYQAYWNPFKEKKEYPEKSFTSILKDVLNKNSYYNHIPARLLKCRIPENIWNSYYKFSIERNPWDKSLSYFHMMNKRNGTNLSLDDYLKSQDFCFNYPTYCDKDGALLVDKVLLYENLNEELGVLFKQLGIPYNGSLGVNAKSNYRQDHRPYRDVYNDAQKQIIEKAFEKEIKLFGYTF